MGSLRTSWEYAEHWVAEEEVLAAARPPPEEVGTVPIGPGGGATLRLLATVLGARAVIEIGTGTGVSGTWLLRGMRPDGVLTSVDVEPEHQRLARLTFAEAGFPATRVRLICGPALEVLPRFTESAYDLLFVDALKTEYPDYLAEGVRLLRPGGMIAFDNALWNGRVSDDEVDDDDTEAIRETLRAVAADAGLVPALLPVGDGLLVAVRR